ncbi:cell cycle checkpoint protein RAD17 isoform X4 [Spodoptera litura]|uniref:Cell cycle checkpoint protein RAD17 isoform X4 n=1 Tax=Spodoptera litura TaxID=69820 RepID=A0A9J7IH07_SPOLT|nr:cell cycle checkpoint protein RAD17 isoform X4 [Spodoptera litura]
MENEVKQRNQRNRRRERAQRMQAQRESKVKDGDSGEDESPTREKPPRPPARRKKSREPLGEEDIIDGFAIMAFRTYEDLEAAVKCASSPRTNALSTKPRLPLAALAADSGRNHPPNNVNSHCDSEGDDDKEKKWFKPMFDFDDEEKPSKKIKTDMQIQKKHENNEQVVSEVSETNSGGKEFIIKDHKHWMKTFEPVHVEDLAVHNKKVQEVEDWIKTVSSNNNSDMLLMTGPVGCGKTITLQVLSKKYGVRITEWITPVDIDIPSENGEYEFKQRQSVRFLDFLLSAANFTSLLDGNSKKLVLVEDFPNTFMRTPSEFTEVLQQYQQRARSPIVFICSESHTDNKNSASNIFTPSLKEQFKIHHVSFNSVAPTNLRAALKRVASIISKKHTAVYNCPTADVIECVVNSSAGDVRSAVLNLHFACLKGGTKQNMDTSIVHGKESKSKTTRKKKTSKFMSLGKDESVSILHGVGRVLNPKVIETDNGSKKFTHTPEDIVEQFISQPVSFVNFLEENYLPHFSNIDHVDKAASALSDSDLMLAEWREKMCQEYGLYNAVASLMLSNKAPVSAWNPVRGPKNMKIQYPTVRELQLLEENYLYKGKILVSDYQTYCKIISNKTGT